MGMSLTLIEAAVSHIGTLKPSKFGFPDSVEPAEIAPESGLRTPVGSPGHRGSPLMKTREIAGIKHSGKAIKRISSDKQKPKDKPDSMVRLPQVQAMVQNRRAKNEAITVIL